MAKNPLVSIPSTLARLLHTPPFVPWLRHQWNAVVRQSEAVLRHWTTLRKTHPRATIGAMVAVPVAALASIAIAISFFTSGLPDVAALERLGEMNQATTVLAADGQIAFTIYKEQRIEVPLDQVSPHLIDAMLAIEDQRFYDHHGFDLVRIGGAFFANIRHGRTTQGGSTITQQLAKLSFLTPDRTYRRKVQELLLARRIENLYTKNQILELYLNKVYFGGGLYGVQAASHGYFGKTAHDLTIAEAALLAGLVKSPSSYSPTARLDRATARRNVVLQAMREAGRLDEAEWNAARSAPVVLEDDFRSEEPIGLYFKEQVRQELVERFGWQRVYQGGLRVYSTIDMRMQAEAETAVADGLKALDERRKAVAARKGGPAFDADGPPLQAALIAMEPGTGYVRAMVGGRDFDESHFNRAVQAKRQPGSAFKPFVYAAALEAGYTPATVLDNLNEPIPTLQGAWAPEDEHSAADSMTLRTALRTSSNRAAVRLLQEVGIPKTVSYAKTMGVGDVPSVPSLALGSGEVTLQTLTAAYAAFANQGDVPKPVLVLRVEDTDGTLLYTGDVTTTHAISAATAYLMSSMLADVINAGTGARARTLGFTLPAAGKTGTTNDYNDAWFVGFTPTLVSGVWVGFDQPHTILPGGFAAEVAVPLWANFMKAATKGDKSTWLTPPPGQITTAVVCRISGLLASDGCDHVEVMDENGHVERRSMVYTEYFAKGTEPTRTCLLHQSRSVVSAIASAFTTSDRPTPLNVLVEAPSAPPAVAATTGTTPAPTTTDDTPKKKRGFFSRVFGRNKDKDDKDKDHNDEQ